MQQKSYCLNAEKKGRASHSKWLFIIKKNWNNRNQFKRRKLPRNLIFSNAISMFIRYMVHKHIHISVCISDTIRYDTILITIPYIFLFICLYNSISNILRKRHDEAQAWTETTYKCIRFRYKSCAQLSWTVKSFRSTGVHFNF